MNDNTDAIDELVSRYLDAEVTDDEAALVESDPELLARADAMRSAIEAVAAPVDIPMIDLDQRRTVALNATSTSTGITDLSAARARQAHVGAAALAGTVGVVVALHREREALAAERDVRLPQRRLAQRAAGRGGDAAAQRDGRDATAQEHLVPRVAVTDAGCVPRREIVGGHSTC